MEPRGPDCSGMLKRGLEIIANASTLDSQGHAREAFKQYGLGLECLISVLKWEKNERIRSTVKAKVQEYMNRAEQLKALLEGNDSNSISLPSTPDTTLVAAPVLPAVAVTSGTQQQVATSGRPASTAHNSSTPAPTPVHQAQVLRLKLGQTGCSYGALFGKYLEGAVEVDIEDPFIRYPHQFYNLVQFCETLVKMKTIRKISLLTSHENEQQLSDIQAALKELAASLRDANVEFIVAINNNFHDRLIRCSNGWRLGLGRGLDIYQKPTGKYVLGACDLDLRPCLETEISIYRENNIYSGSC